jgi:hypothetical protein
MALSSHPLLLHLTINQAYRSNPNIRSLRVLIESTSLETAHRPTQTGPACPAVDREQAGVVAFPVVLAEPAARRRLIDVREPLDADGEAQRGTLLDVVSVSDARSTSQMKSFSQSP